MANPRIDVERMPRVTRASRAETFRRLAEAPDADDVIFDLLDGPSPLSCIVEDSGAVLVVVSEEGGVYARLEPDVAAELALQLAWAAIEGARRRVDPDLKPRVDSEDESEVDDG